ncbi:hypothetical protein DBB36_08560 [Flavobacterium sp. WLB]|uniref:hypothetical protein n=1 Tax=unclassified Flavobacterium TaxID=196869 RepID=UPI0006ABE9B5|nr:MULTISPECIES: hypothetical protein [unclassified Flavobacterium]KOP36642.1 hypothetical protein AKO67_19710 [Flavobacterium sp. VMW]OWU91936.1 hypothetical protein APR43_04780 [Flavobacterium sp. NLM]PUU70408.1 hypothetical protein DBB36_08560 [Flavobacterium sp. WLB]
MKNLLGLLSAALLVFTSCSKDDNNESSDPASPILVKKITKIDSKGSSSSENYLYNGNKIVSITEADGSLTKFTYNGNEIVTKEEFDKNGLSKGPVEYGYTDGLMTSYVEKYDDDYNSKTKYKHNNDGTVSYEQFKVDIKTGLEVKFQQTGKLTYKDGNLIKAERSYDKFETVEIYEYDTKNSPLKNILGWNLLLDEEPAVKNIIKKVDTSGSQGNIHTDTYISTYTYDVNNYPTEKITKLSGSTDTETVQYVY